MDDATQSGTAIQELIANEHVSVSRGTHNDWVLTVEPEATTAGPALDPVETWASHHRKAFRVHELPHADEAKSAYTADRREN